MAIKVKTKLPPAFGATAQVQEVKSPEVKQAPAKPKVVAEEVLSDAGSTIVEKVDQLVIANAAVKAVQPFAKQADAAKKFLCSIADTDGDPAEEVEINGSNGNKVVFSKKNDVQSIKDKPGLIKKLKEKLGAEGLLEFVEVPMGKLGDYLTVAEIAQFVDKVPNAGPRSLRAVIAGPEK